MNIERIVNYETDENCYIVYDDEKNGIVIDPGNKYDIIFDKIKELGLIVKYILLTHCHYDHIEGLQGLRKITASSVVSTFECNIGIQSTSANLSILFSDPIKAEPVDIIINDNDIINVGDIEIKAITTPGHTKGGVCYLIGEDLFSGDTLFLRSVGRCDFPGGDSKELKNSIRNKLYILDDDIVVHPGHGNDTKIYYEKKYNMFIKE